jgi:predicted secreted protein
VELRAEPPLEPAVARALAALLEDVEALRSGCNGGESAWRRAGLVEAVDGAEDALDYAFSPRSTRGATRA